MVSLVSHHKALASERCLHECCHTSLLTLTSSSRTQLNADCLDDLPLDYDLALGGMGGVGGVGALALEAVVSGASSDGTLSEGGSSVVLDPGVRRMGLPQDYQDPDTLRDSPVTATTDTLTGGIQRSIKRRGLFVYFYLQLKIKLQKYSKNALN